MTDRTANVCDTCDGTGVCYEPAEHDGATGYEFPCPVCNASSNRVCAHCGAENRARYFCWSCRTPLDAIPNRVCYCEEHPDAEVCPLTCMPDATPNRVHGFYRLGKVKVVIEDGPLSTPCHVWQGTVDGQGYAKRGHHGRGHTNAHRDVYQLEHGKIMPGYILHHECENKLCLNVDHMQAVTRGDHVRIHRKGKPLIGGRGG